MHLIDFFEEDRPSGRVIDSLTTGRAIRKGVDVEGVIAIDHGALRLQPLLQPGWARSGIAYGPFERQDGLTMAVAVLNGHNTSQSGDLSESLKRRLGSWARGSKAVPLERRMLGWLLGRRKKYFLRQIWRWFLMSRSSNGAHTQVLDENIALGWFDQEAPADPTRRGSALVMHAAGPENGELWTRVHQQLSPGMRSLQNLPIVYMVVLRRQGAAYYAASFPDAHGLPAFPELRPLAIDSLEDDPQVFAAFFQSVQGQIGFRVDTRIYGFQVENFPEFANWYGSAHAADRLNGQGALVDHSAEIGGQWQVLKGGFLRSEVGLRADQVENLAVLQPGAPSGLVHVLFDAPPKSRGELGLYWRQRDMHNGWELRLDGQSAYLGLRISGLWQDIKHDPSARLLPGKTHSLQVCDDGCWMATYLDGKLLFDQWFQDDRLASACGVGISSIDPDAEVVFRSFEAHPRTIPAPAGLALRLPEAQKGDRILFREEFTGEAADLDVHPSPISGVNWRRELGTGVIYLPAGKGARVQASVESPAPGRTAYTLPWESPDFADLEIDVLPPGTGRDQGHKGRAGLIFWQDAGNYIIVNTWLDDYYGGASISSFFTLDGFEDIYDAVWTNVGSRVFWGTPYRLRVAFDGLNYTAYVNDEPVLYRSLSDVYPDSARILINRVGIVANWEWGNDTGSEFRSFIARVKE